MKPEKELKWLSKLYSSKSCSYPLKLKLNPIALCKKDFERIVDSSENNADFSIWFNKLIELDVFIYSNKVKKGFIKETDGYIVNGSNLIKYVKSNKLYNEFWKLFNFDRVI